MLKEQKKAADEQNQRNLEAYKILRQERDSMADTLQQAEISIFSKRFSALYFCKLDTLNFLLLLNSRVPLSEFCSSYWFDPVASSAKRMHGPCRQLYQDRHQAGQGDIQAPPDQHQSGGFRVKFSEILRQAPSIL